MLHRSSFSSILPLFEGVSVGDHPVLSRLCRGFFDQRPPPSWRLFPSWKVASVFVVFDGLQRPLDFFRPSTPLRLPPRRCVVSASVGVGVSPL